MAMFPIFAAAATAIVMVAVAPGRACARAIDGHAESTLDSNKFFFGSATAAYQIEGYRDVDGRTKSIWDAFDTDGASEYVPAKKPYGVWNVHGGESGRIADGDFTAYSDTTRLLKQYGFDAYRMSISWTRILSYSLSDQCTGPEKTGKCQLNQPVINQKGLEHYKTVLKGLKDAGLITAVTLWHWDTPLAVEEWAIITECAETNPFTVTQTGSAWLCPEIADIFSHYAKIVTEALDQYVDHWITLNEPLTVTSVGYAPPAKHAPGRCSDRDLCWAGNETIEPYYVAKNMMRAHAKAYWAYNGSKPMGFAANADWYEPISKCQDDQQAAVNAMVWEIGLFWDLLTTGAWAPEIAEAVQHPRLPAISDDDSKLLRGAHGSVYYQNMYTASYAWAQGSGVGSDCPSPQAPWRAASQAAADFTTDASASKSATNPITKKEIGALAPGSSWLHFVPTGLPKLQRWIAARYKADIPSLKLVVTENGWGGAYADKQQAVDDVQRCEYYRQYLGNMSQFSVDDGYGSGPLVLSNDPPSVLGYFAWSLMDNFEWNDGHLLRRTVP
jgi:beta-glucosidase